MTQFNIRISNFFLGIKRYQLCQSSIMTYCYTVRVSKETATLPLGLIAPIFGVKIKEINNMSKRKTMSCETFLAVLHELRYHNFGNRYK